MHYRHQTELCQRRNGTSIKKYSPKTFPTSVQKAIEQMGTFNEDRIIMLIEMRKKLLETLQFGHAGATKC